MFEGETADALFEPHGDDTFSKPADEFAGALTRSIETGLTDPESARTSWIQRPPGPGRPVAGRASADLQEVTFAELLARRSPTWVTFSVGLPTRSPKSPHSPGTSWT